MKRVFDYFKSGRRSVSSLVQILHILETYLDAKHSGLAWESTVEVAIILRMFEAHYYSTDGPSGLSAGAVEPDLDFLTLPDEITTLEASKAFIDKSLDMRTKPTLLFVRSANTQYPEVEGFVAFTVGDGISETKIVGFQTRTSDRQPEKAFDTSIINGGARLVRSLALAQNPRAPKSGWTYMSSKEVRDPLGNSLLLAMPHAWLKDPPEKPEK